LQVHDVLGILEVGWEQEGYSRPVWFLSQDDLVKKLSLEKKGKVLSDSQRPQLDRLGVSYRHLHGIGYR
jgi:hypothetical protein